MLLKLFARMPRFCATRIFALGQEDRSFYLSFFLLSLPSLPRLYLENGRTGRYPDRKCEPWTSPSFFLFSLGRQRAEDLHPARSLQASFFSSHSFLFSTCFCSFFAFLFSSLCLALFPRLLLVHLRLSMDILFLPLLFYVFLSSTCAM